jgi:hypothetical protein
MVLGVNYVPGSTQKLYQLTGEKDKERNQPTINITESSFALAGTDLGFSFEHNGRIYFLFGDSNTTQSSASFRPDSGDAIAWTEDTDPEKGIHLQFVTAPDGYYLSPTVPPITLGSFEVPMAGFSANGKMYIFFTTDHRKDADGADLMGRSVLAWSDDGGQTPFHYLYDLSILNRGGKFINVSPVIVDNAAIPGLPSTSGKSLLLWGSGTYRKSNPYLAYIPLDSIEDQSKSQLQYFAGIEFGSHLPSWSTRESDAVKLFEHPVIGELSVTWNPFLKQWLMLYNADNPRGINFHVAEKPWGLWSPPALLFDPWVDGGYCHFMHRSWVVDPTTHQIDPATQCDRVSDTGREFVWGGEYGPYVISPYTRGNRTTTTIYFVMSTWNPYNTMLMKSTLALDTSFPLQATISSVARTQNHLDLFTVGTDDGIYSTWWDSNVDQGVWDHGWFRIGDPHFFDGFTVNQRTKISAVARQPNHLDLFVVGKDDAVYSTWWDGNVDQGRWDHVWFRIGDSHFFDGFTVNQGTVISAVACQQNHLDLFVVGKDGYVYSNSIWWDDNVHQGAWNHGWFRVY